MASADAADDGDQKCPEAEDLENQPERLGGGPKLRSGCTPVTKTLSRGPSNQLVSNRVEDIQKRDERDYGWHHTGTKGTRDGESYSIPAGAAAADTRHQRGLSSSHQVPTQKTDLIKRKSKTPPFSEKELQSFLERNSSDVLKELALRKGEFLALLNQDELSADALMLTVRVLSCMCYLDPVSEALLTQELNTVLNMIDSSPFLCKHLTRYLVGLTTVQPEEFDDNDADDVQSLASDVKMIFELLQLFLQHKPSRYSEVGVPLILLQKVVTTTALNNAAFDPESSLMTQVQQLNECCNSLQQDQKRDTRVMETPPPNNFRDIQVFPESTEIRQMAKPFLRRNIIQGRYESVEHYLDVQFRLLREDFVAPLREGVTEFLSGTTGRIQDIRIYYNVSIQCQKMEKIGLVHTLQFQMRGRRPERWESSKRLLYGSFVCLSSDNFKHILCATVENRSPYDLRRGLVDVRFLTPNCRTFTGPFIMAESAAYFEAYRHVLHGLQELDEGSFPFKRYIVDVASSVEPPVYLRGEDPVVYDLRSLVVGADQIYDHQAQNITDAAYVSILHPESWPDAEDLHLDDSQKTALQTALTKEFAIIQGPPGTGKTYIGLKIVEVLLDNTPWHDGLSEETKASPILVVCYTNHALDQFLEGIIAFGEKNVVRVGNRSTSEVLQSKTLSKLRRQRPRNFRDKFTTVQEVKKKLQQTDEAIHRTVLKLELPRKVVVNVSVLKEYMGETHYSDLSLQWQKGKPKGQTDPSKNLLKWLNVDEFAKEEECGPTADESQDELQEDDDDDRIEVEDEDKVIQQERQVDDLFDFDAAREQRRQTVEDEVLHQYAAGCLKCIPGSALQAELQRSCAMTDEEAHEVKCIWNLKVCDRWRLYRLWVKRYKDELQTELNMSRQKFETLLKEMQAITAQEDLQILREANVIGMTTTGAARCRSLLQLLGPRIVVVEEAAEVLEAHIVTTLTAKCQHLILIGDHQQLKPNPTVYRLAKLFNLDISLFERMINNGVPCKSLTHQHRMRPEISNLMKKHFYKKLQDDESVFNRDNIKGMQHNMFFINHQNFEDTVDDNRSRSNQFEAKFLVELCRYLLRQGYKPSQITILTAYTGQLFCFRRLMDRATFEGVRVCVVDNFQGEENDIILLSLVRSNKEGSIGFLRTSNRVCVALSRARMGFYCIGNAAILKKTELWQDITSTLQTEGRIGTSLPLVCQNHPKTITYVATAKDFTEKAPCGGCDRECSLTLRCGHDCALFCHPYDTRHEDYKCQKPCKRLCKREEHSCPLQCHQPCKPCEKKVPKLMSNCGHEIQVVCHEFDTVTCPLPCPRGFADCRHHCPRLCGQTCPQTCPKKCERSLACGHHCPEECGRPCAQYCKVQVERTLKCGHKDSMDCSKNPEEVQCRTKVTKTRTICGHRSKMFCFEDPDTKDCQERCVKTLRCGHQCPNVCGRPCKASESLESGDQFGEAEDGVKLCEEIVEKSYPSCDHVVQLPCHQDISLVPCSRTCGRLLACGHRCPKKCSQPCPGEKLCGTFMRNHAKYEKNFLEFCREKCENVLPCGHPCPNKCGEPCPADEASLEIGRLSISPSEFIHKFSIKCEKSVQKKLPECGHYVTAQCHQDVASLSCPNTCNKTLACGHLCRNLCSEPCKCRNIVPKWLPICRHVARLPCYQDVSSYACVEKCQKKLVCGHQCPNKCSEPCPGKNADNALEEDGLTSSLLSRHNDKPARVCNKIVTKTHSNCGHSVRLPCHTNVDSVTCYEKCELILSCGHQCPNKCCEPCLSLHPTAGDTGKCQVQVSKELPLCGHFMELPCYKNVNSVVCSRKCERILSCGHECPNRCGDLCPDNKGLVPSACKVSSNVTSTASTKCEKVVKKKLPSCGHVVGVPCHKSADLISCPFKCQKVLSCGHRCPNDCGDPCLGETASSGDTRLSRMNVSRQKCEEIVTKVLPCGHSYDVACWEADASIACREMCTAVLECGHKCHGNCHSCKQGADHLQCSEKCGRQLLCGHTCNKACGKVCSADCGSCEVISKRTGARSRVRHPKPVLKTFPCKHNIGHRQLKTNACILRCSQTLRCRHLCIGVCGEPCPPLCSVCQTRRVVAKLPNQSIRPRETFIYLPNCEHLCETRFLDRMMASVLRSFDGGFFVIRPPLCPKCKEPIGNCPRYENILQRISKTIDLAKDKCKEKEALTRTRLMRGAGATCTAHLSFTVGRWIRCARGHVFYQDETVKQEQLHELRCPKCSPLRPFVATCFKLT